MPNLKGKVAVVTGAGEGVALGLAGEYGFADVDGRRPRPLTLEDV